MKFTVILAWIALAVTMSAAPKFGVVRVKDIYSGLPSTAAIQKKMQEEREAIPYNTRAERFRSSLKELKELQTQLQAVKDDLESEHAKKLIRTFEIRRQESATLHQEFEVFRAEEEKRISTEIVVATRETLNRISAAARQIAMERNLDGVFDSSGNSNTGLPFMLYAANAEDLTEDVIALLGEKPNGEEAAKVPEAVDADAQPEPEPEPERE